MTSHSSHTELVREQALSLPNGANMRGVCPECGTTSAFSITRVDGEVQFICFRAGCTCRGNLASKGISIDSTVIRQKKLFRGRLSALTSRETYYISHAFRIKREWLDLVRWGDDDDRVYYPQYDTKGRVHGYIARYYPALNDALPLKGAKALWKQATGYDTGLCFPNMEVLTKVVEQKRVCVVEDYPSMLRINSQTGIPTCCLGGTNIYEGHISTMLELDIRELVIVLDADAITKAVKLKRSLSLAFDKVTIIPLVGADPKDMGVRELSEIFEVLL